MALSIGYEPNDITKYSNGLDAEVWVHPQLITTAYPKPEEFTFNVNRDTGPPLSSDTYIGFGLTSGFTPIPVRIPHGYTLECLETPAPNTRMVVQVDSRSYPLDTATGTRYTPANSNGMVINRKIAAWPAGQMTARYIDMLPLFSVESGDLGETKGTYTIRNIQAGAYNIYGAKAIDSKFTMTGYNTNGDTMLNLCRSAMNRTDAAIYMRIIFPNRSCYEFTSLVVGNKMAFKADEAFMADLEFTISSTPLIRDFTLS